MLTATALFLMETAMPDHRFALIVVASLSTTLLASCGTGGHSRDDSYDAADRDWYESRQDDIGLVAVSHTELAGDEWQIEGRDAYGHYMEVDVDVVTGNVVNVDRS